MIRFILEDGSEVRDWNDIGEGKKIKEIYVDVVSLGFVKEPPWIVFKDYDKYMFQKFMSVAISTDGRGVVKNVPFGGFQVGGYLNDLDVWVVMEVDFVKRLIFIDLLKQITSIAIKEGVGRLKIYD